MSNQQEKTMVHHQCPKCGVVNTGPSRRKAPVCVAVVGDDQCGTSMVAMDDDAIHAYHQPAPLPPEPSDAEKMADAEWWRRGPFAPSDASEIVAPAALTIMTPEQQAKLDQFMADLLTGDV